MPLIAIADKADQARRGGLMTLSEAIRITTSKPIWVMPALRPWRLNSQSVRTPRTADARAVAGQREDAHADHRAAHDRGEQRLDMRDAEAEVHRHREGGDPPLTAIVFHMNAGPIAR